MSYTRISLGALHPETQLLTNSNVCSAVYRLLPFVKRVHALCFRVTLDVERRWKDSLWIFSKLSSWAFFPNG